MQRLLSPRKIRVETGRNGSRHWDSAAVLAQAYGLDSLSTLVDNALNRDLIWLRRLVKTFMRLGNGDLI
ncbi:hypothetical protein, partial [Burkholderia gladioli]|uniref:hypothetical protein n=1 Tax=Burkholderia gladioli TaxID=28095 RepID=UPI001ABB3BA8